MPQNFSPSTKNVGAHRRRYERYLASFERTARSGLGAHHGRATKGNTVAHPGGPGTVASATLTALVPVGLVEVPMLALGGVSLIVVSLVAFLDTLSRRERPACQAGSTREGAFCSHRVQAERAGVED